MSNETDYRQGYDDGYIDGFKEGVKSLRDIVEEVFKIQNKEKEIKEALCSLLDKGLLKKAVFEDVNKKDFRIKD